MCVETLLLMFFSRCIQIAPECVFFADWNYYSAERTKVVIRKNHSFFVCVWRQNLPTVEVNLSGMFAHTKTTLDKNWFCPVFSFAYPAPIRQRYSDLEGLLWQVVSLACQRV